MSLKQQEKYNYYKISYIFAWVFIFIISFLVTVYLIAVIVVILNAKNYGVATNSIILPFFLVTCIFATPSIILNIIAIIKLKRLMNSIKNNTHVDEYLIFSVVLLLFGNVVAGILMLLASFVIAESEEMKD